MSLMSGSLSPRGDEERQRLVGDVLLRVGAEHRADGGDAAEHVAGVEADVERHLPAVAHAVGDHARPVDRVLAEHRLHVPHHEFRLARHPAVVVAGLRPHHDVVVVLADLAERAGHLLAVLAALPGRVEPDDQPVRLVRVVVVRDVDPVFAAEALVRAVDEPGLDLRLLALLGRLFRRREWNLGVLLRAWAAPSRALHRRGRQGQLVRQVGRRGDELGGDGDGLEVVGPLLLIPFLPLLSCLLPCSPRPWELPSASPRW